MKKIILFILLSVFVHVSFWGPISFFGSRIQSETSDAEHLEFEILPGSVLPAATKKQLGKQGRDHDLPNGAEKRQADQQVGSGNLSRQIAKSLQAGISQNSVQEMNRVISAESERAKAGYFGQAGLGSGAFAEKVGFQEGLAGTYFWQALAARIDEGFIYPEDLVKMRREGTFQIDFYVNQKGQLLGDFVKVSGSDPYLKIYTQALVIEMLRDPLPRRSWYEKDEKIPISIQFQFEINTATYPTKPHELLVQNNQFTFVRRTYLEPLWVEKTNRIITKYVPPIIPFPGGVYIDILRLVEFIQNLHPNAIDDHERLLQRTELSREQLEMYIESTRKKRMKRDSSPGDSQYSRGSEKDLVS